jgi:hypothetical protein
MKLRLNQGIPWSKDELTGFALAVFGSAVLASVLMAMIVPDTIVNPDAGPGRPPVVSNPAKKNIVPLTFVYVAGALMLLNYSPLKKLHGLVQYAACVIISMCVGVADLSFRRDGAAMVPIHLVMGALWFLVFRVNWWFYWDNPSRRTLAHRVTASILFTAIPMLGLGMALWRLAFGMGVHDVTTTFIANSERPDREPLEAIIEDPALAQHEARMQAIRAGKAGFGSGRTSAADKDSVSESI